MNESIKRFVQANAYQLVAAVITIIVTLVATYVSFRLFQQSTTFDIQAMRKDLTELQENSVQRRELQPINEKLEDIQQNVNRIVDYLIEQ